MSENIEDLKSLRYPPNIPVGELFQKMILNNSQTLDILRILENFENSLKIHFFLFRKWVQISTIFIKTVQARKSSYWLDVTRVLADSQCFKTAEKRFYKITIVIEFVDFIVCTLIVCCFGSQNNAQLQPSKVDPGVSQIEKNTKLNKRTVILLITPKVSVLIIKILASIKILTWAPPQVDGATRTWNESKGKHNYANRGGNHTEAITSHQSAKNWWKFCYLHQYCYLRD